MPRPQFRMFQRYWVLPGEGVVPHMADIVQPQSVIVVPIPKELLHKTAVSFLQFDKKNPRSEAYVQGIQSILYATHKMRECVEEMKSKNTAVPVVDQFAQVRLETVYSNDVETPKVLQYRLWIYVTNSVVNTGDGLEAMLKENDTIQKKYDGTYSVSAVKGYRVATQLPGSKDWKECLHPHEQYRLITDKATWSRSICDMYIGSTRTSSQMDKVESGQHTLRDAANPANPANVFNVPDAILLQTPKNAHPDQLKIENYRVHDAFNGTVNYKFPPLGHLPHHVIRIPFNECAPSTICYRWLPEYQTKKLQALRKALSEEYPQVGAAWNIHTQNVSDDLGNPMTRHISSLEGPEQQLRNDILQHDLVNNNPVEDEQPFEMGSPYDNRTVEALLNNRMYQYYYSSSFKLLQDENQKTLSSLKKTTDAKIYTESYENFEKEAFENFEGRCWSSDSDISDIGHVLREWGDRKDVKDYSTKHVKFDPNLSVFGNMVARRMEFYDDFLFISSAHKNFFIMNYAKLDAYRHTHDLHFNIISTGVGGTSKSFLFDLLEKLSIEGTVEQVSYETLRANAIDRDNNDTITAMNEIPSEMTTPQIGGSSMQSSFKERLTSLKVKCKLFQKDEVTGYRDQRTSVSECIGVWFGATNDDFSNIDEALITRFYQAYFTEFQRDQRDIASLMYASKSMSDAEKRKVEEFKMEMKMEQFRYFLVEKLIMTQCLPDFNSTTARIFFRKFMEKVNKDGNFPHARNLERMMIMTRILSICHGLECLFNIPTGKYYGVPFDISHLKDLKPYLQAPQEILHFVCGLFTDQLMNPLENEILDAVKGLHENNKDARRFREQGLASDDPALQAAQANVHVTVSPTEARASQSQITFNDPNVRAPTSVVPRKKIDYSYSAFRLGITHMAAEIYRQMERNISRPSQNQIKSFLVSLKQRTIKSKNFTKADPKQSDPTVDATSPLTSSPALLADGDGVYFHYSLLVKERAHTNAIANCLKELWYKKTLPEKLIYGVCVEGQPQLWQTLDATPVPEGKFVIHNVLYVNRCARIMLYNNDLAALEDEDRRGQEMDIVNVDLDTKSVMHQLDLLELPWNEESLKFYHPHFISARENAWLAKNFGFVKNDDPNAKKKLNNTFSYPLDFIAKHEERKGDYEKALKAKGEEFEKFSKYFTTNTKRTRDHTQTGEVFANMDIPKKVRKDDCDFAILDDEISAPVDPQSPMVDPQAPVQIIAIAPMIVDPPIAPPIPEISLTASEDFWEIRASQVPAQSGTPHRNVDPKPAENIHIPAPPKPSEHVPETEVVHPPVVITHDNMFDL